MYKTMIKALENEVAIDAADMLNIYKDRKCSIPVLRPIKLFNKIKSNILIKFLFYMLTLFWIIIFPIFMIYKFFKYLTKLEQNNYHAVEKSIFVATVGRLQDMYIGLDENRPTQWLVVPWIKIYKVNFENDYKKIDLMSILNLKDLFHSFMYTLKGLYVWMRIIKHPIEILQSYVLFEYFMLKIALDKLDKIGVNEYWYANHYDRWSVLLDASNDIKNVLIQHGFLNKKFVLPYKLKNIRGLYILSEDSIITFKNNIIKWNENIYINKLKNTLFLQDIDSNDKSIFLISRPAQFDFDIQLIQEIEKRFIDLKIYIKPHPLYDNNMYIKTFESKNNCILIKDNDFYPNIQTVISGYSTLAVEYEQLGKYIIWIPEETIESIIHNIDKKIFSR